MLQSYSFTALIVFLCDVYHRTTAGRLSLILLPVWMLPGQILLSSCILIQSTSVYILHAATAIQSVYHPIFWYFEPHAQFTVKIVNIKIHAERLLR